MSDITNIENVNVTVAEAVEAEPVKPYTLRKLCADDLFPMARIISKIGIDQFKEIFYQDNIKSLLKNITGDSVDTDNSNDVVTSVGVSVLFSMGQIVLTNLTSCRYDIYNFLSGLSGMDTNDIATLDIVVFAEMIIDVFQKSEFGNFIKVVSKLLK
jgi:hypothetical protein